MSITGWLYRQVPKYACSQVLRSTWFESFLILDLPLKLTRVAWVTVANKPYQHNFILLSRCSAGKAFVVSTQHGDSRQTQMYRPDFLSSRFVHILFTVYYRNWILFIISSLGFSAPSGCSAAIMLFAGIIDRQSATMIIWRTLQKIFYLKWRAVGSNMYRDF